MTEPQFKEVLNFFRNNAHQNARALLTQYGFSEVDFAHYGMAMQSWSNNMFNEIAYKGVTQQDFDLSKHIKWKLAKNLISFQELIKLFISNTDLKDVISSHCLDKYNEYKSDEKDQLQRHGIINENVIFKKDLAKGVVPYNSFHLYRENLEKALLIKDYIKTRYDANQITAEEVYYYFTHNFLTKNEVNSYCDKSSVHNPIPRPEKLIDIPPDLWNSTVLAKRTDVILIGSSGAGKTMFLASLLKYCESIGNLNYNTLNSKGSIYGNILTSAIDKGRLIRNTPPEVFLTMALDYTVKVKSSGILGSKCTDKNAPVNLIEIAGEAFKRSFGVSDENGIPENIRNAVYNLNDNPKLYIFTIPVDEQEITINTGNSDFVVNAQGFYNYFLDYIKRIGRLNNAIGIALVFTKWDKYKDGDAEFFLENRCLNLYEQLKRIVNTNPKVKAAYFTHSLGSNVDESLNTYKYDSNDMKEIYNWIVDILPTN
jgi:hypothetical protein